MARGGLLLSSCYSLGLCCQCGGWWFAGFLGGRLRLLQGNSKPPSAPSSMGSSESCCWSWLPGWGGSVPMARGLAALVLFFFSAWKAAHPREESLWSPPKLQNFFSSSEPVQFCLLCCPPQRTHRVGRLQELDPWPNPWPR